MALPARSLLPRFARLTLDLEARRQCRSKIQANLEAAARAGVFVSAERELLDNLQTLLEQADALLAGLTSSDATVDPAARLAELEALADDVQWEVAAGVAEELANSKARLEATAATQQAQAREQSLKYRQEIDTLLTPITDLDREALSAYQYGAAVREERRTSERLKAVLDSAARLVGEGKFSQVEELLGKLRVEAGSLPTLRDQLKEKQREARRLARQADLLLLRTDLASKRHHYTLLLRTPGEQGTAGIDIQDESTMVAEDHGYFVDAMAEITSQINDGLVRGFTPGVVPAAPPVAPAAGAGVGTVPVAPTDASATGGASEAPAADAPASEAPAAAGGAPAAAPPANDPLRLRQTFAPPAEVTRSAVDLLEDIGDLMYRLVVPETMQRFLTETKSSLTIRTNDIELPWELMRIQTERGGREFLCLDRPVARMPTGRAFPRRETTIERPEGRLLRFLLIYSDPDKDYPLTAAKKEVKQIKDELGDQVEVMDTWEAEKVTGKALNRILRAGEYDVIHYAGHAAFDRDKPDLSGLLLWNKEVFFAQKARRLLEGRPLVFVNACESGRTANEDAPEQLVEGALQRPAEGILSSFIYGGAAACVGSIWPVYDQSAREFAVAFYRRVLEGLMVGEALRLTRRDIRAKYPKQVTWASYVLYGDPTARLAK